MRRLTVFLGLLLTAVSCRGDAIDRSGLLASGPMLGYSTPREVLLWAQTTRAASVQFRYWPEGKPALRQTTARVTTGPQDDFTARLRATRLEPGVRYQYEVRLNGSKVDLGYPLRFQTQPLWQWRTDPPDFTVAFGSCTYTNEEPYDRPGEPYGQGFEIFPNILRTRPDLMIWMGDNVYLREVDWDSRDGIFYRYSHARATPQLQALLGNVHNYAIWDDHDYGPNNSDRSYVHKQAALEAFRSFWGNPTYGLPSLPGTFTRFSWGDADFFLLDNRWYRSPTEAPPLEDKVMLGAGQLSWLIDALTSSEGTFKIVAVGGQVLNPVAQHETYARFPFERGRLLDALRQRRIEGLIFLSGDRHFTELSRLPRPGAYPLYDYTSSPLTSGLADSDWVLEEENRLRVEGTLLVQKNFGLLRFSGPAEDRTLTLQALSSQGELLWERSLQAQDLTFPETQADQR
ncbi:MAG TPA: alkaline phosphatase D family protein [Acidobacteriota bacterium]|nr:alkaline phosphatase D family protein [Acidobacteriota bacterium]